MAKIIKKGKDLDWERKEKCLACGSEFIVKENDVKVESLLSGEYFTNCPACGKYIPYSHLYGTNHRIPDHIKAYADRKYKDLLFRKIVAAVVIMVAVTLVIYFGILPK